MCTRDTKNEQSIICAVKKLSLQYTFGRERCVKTVLLLIMKTCKERVLWENRKKEFQRK